MGVAKALIAISGLLGEAHSSSTNRVAHLASELGPDNETDHVASQSPRLVLCGVFWNRMRWWGKRTVVAGDAIGETAGGVVEVTITTHKAETHV